MDTTNWLILALGSLLVGVATWIGCWLWYGRKIESLSQRLQKSEKARHFSNQQTLQARKQLEALQKDLAEQNAALAKAQVAKQRNRHLEDALRASAVAELESGDKMARPAHGFADTQPLI
jgi:uncharacterized membrane protein YccC